MTPKIVFLILESDNKKRIVCDITEKLYQSQKRVALYVSEAGVAEEFDRLLWIWKQSSFIPHLYTEQLSTSYEEQVVITTKIDHTDGYDTLLLYDPAPAEVLNQFNLVIDFAEKYNMTSLTKSRERFKEYKDKNWPLESLPPGQFLQMPLS